MKLQTSTLCLSVNLYTSMHEDSIFTSSTGHRAIILHSHLRYEGLAICRAQPILAESSLLGIGPVQGIETINIKPCMHCSQLPNGLGMIELVLRRSHCKLKLERLPFVWKTWKFWGEFKRNGSSHGNFPDSKK